MHVRTAAALLLLSFFALPARAAGPFALHNGDRVVFYGDEITAVQFYDNALEPRLYPSFVEAFVATRFPDLQVEFVDSAWNGDRVSGGAGGSIEVRMKRDVIAYRPTVLTVMLGMNDASSAAFHPEDHERFTTGYNLDITPASASFDPKRFAAYCAGYQHLVEISERALPGLRVVALKPSPYDDETQPTPEGSDFNPVLQRYGSCLEPMGGRDHLAVVDANSALIEVLRSANAADPVVARQIIPDRIHPSPAGHLIIAEALLKAWNAPALVSNVEIDAHSRSVVRAENADPRELKVGETITWTQTDNALPFPLDPSDPAVALIVRSSDFVQALDEEALKVDGLTSSRYELRIDGAPVGTFEAAQLQSGINLALLDTPMKKQAARVFGVIQERENLHFGLWKRVAFPLEDVSLANTQQALDTMTALEQDLRGEEHAAAQPHSHRYELSPTDNAVTATRLP